MKTWKQAGLLALAAAMALCLNMPARARDQDGAKAKTQFASFWALSKEDGKIVLILAGQPKPVTVAMAETSHFAGVCQDCKLPYEFKPGEAGKNCNVCGCSVSNAACMIGKPVKSGKWQDMVKALPPGAGLWLTLNDPEKPDSGVKKLAVNLRTVLLPVTGLETQTPDQLLALVKPLGGTKVELIDDNTRLSIRLKEDWSDERAAKLEKALAKIDAKITKPEAPKADDAKPDDKKAGQ